MSTLETKPLPPHPPRKPEPHECCGTGCIPCVMDIYEEELWEYEQSLKRLQALAHAVNPTESNAP
jgi:hypothetical protein